LDIWIDKGELNWKIRMEKLI